MDLYKELELDSIAKNGDYKIDELNKGTHFYKHLTKLGEQFWLFTLFHEASKEDLLRAKNALLKKAGVCCSEPINELFSILSKYNGMQLFSNSLIFYGVSDKVDYRYLSEPNSIEKNNLILPREIKPNWIAIGYYSMDSNANPILFVDAGLPKKNCFSAILKNGIVTIQKEWDSIESMLIWCLRKIKNNYDSSGYKIDSDLSKPVIIRNKTYIK